MADSASTGGEFYSKNFDPRAYLEDYFKFGSNPTGDDIMNFELTHLCKAFATGGLKGDTLLDIGTGPSIYHLLSACESFKEITASDYCESNHRELQKWLKNEPEAFDWTSVVKFVCELERNGATIADKEEKLRKTVKQILKCDILKSNPLEPVLHPQCDCVLSCLCLEAACKTQAEVCSALKNISTLVKSGGHLVLCGVLNSTHYQVGKVMFSDMTLTEDLLRKAVTGAGFTIKEMEVSARADPEAMKEETSYSDIFFLVAKKI